MNKSKYFKSKILESKDDNSSNLTEGKVPDSVLKMAAEQFDRNIRDFELYMDVADFFGLEPDDIKIKSYDVGKPVDGEWVRDDTVLLTFDKVQVEYEGETTQGNSKTRFSGVFSWSNFEASVMLD